MSLKKSQSRFLFIASVVIAAAVGILLFDIPIASFVRKKSYEHTAPAQASFLPLSREALPASDLRKAGNSIEIQFSHISETGPTKRRKAQVRVTVRALETVENLAVVLRPPDGQRLREQGPHEPPSRLLQGDSITIDFSVEGDLAEPVPLIVEAKGIVNGNPVGVSENHFAFKSWRESDNRAIQVLNEAFKKQQGDDTDSKVQR